MIQRLWQMSLVLLSYVSLNAQSGVPSAAEVMREARAVAAKENKKVFIIFHASWCIWCHRMDSSINDPSCSDFFRDNYVIRHLTVMEADDRKMDENAGALQMLQQFGGDKKGIPYWLIFDKDGKVVADSRIRPEGAGPSVDGSNSGCPAEKEEVDYFLRVLRKTSHLSDASAAAIERRFSQNRERQ